MSREQYLYASARARVLENYLLDQTSIARMIDAPTAEAAFKVFNDLDYAGELLDLKPEQYQEALGRKMARIRKLFVNILPDKDLVKFLFLKRDFHNLKLLFKQKYHRVDGEPYLSSGGTENLADLKKYVLLGGEVSLDPQMKQTIDRTKEIFDKDPSPDNIDNTLDQKYAGILWAIAVRINNKFIKNLVLLQGDMANIKIFLRGKKAGKLKGWLREHLIERGNIPEHVFLNHYDDADRKNLFKTMELYFPERMKAVFNEYLTNEKFWRLEKGLEELELDYVKQSALVAYGPEVIIGYYYAKRNAVRNIRTIMTGKFNNIPPDKIRSRVREIYK